MSKISYEVITSSADLVGLREDWQCLTRTWSAPLLDFKWIYAAADIFYEVGELFVVVLYRGNQPAGIAPLARGHRDGVAWLEFIGARSLFEASGFLYRQQADLEDLMRIVWSFRCPVAFERAAFGGCPADQLSSRISRYGVTARTDQVLVPRLELSGNWEDYFASQSAQRRYDFRRSEKRLASGGSLEVCFHRPHPQSAEHLLNEAFAIEDRSWKHDAGTSILQSTAMQDFFSRVGAAYAESGELVVGLLSVEETPLAMQIGLIREQRYWTLKIGYDRDWKHCSPGTYLMTKAIKMVFEQDLRGIEFLGSSESWLSHWANGCHELHNQFFIPFSGEGLRAAAVLVERACRN